SRRCLFSGRRGEDASVAGPAALLPRLPVPGPLAARGGARLRRGRGSGPGHARAPAGSRASGRSATATERAAVLARLSSPAGELARLVRLPVARRGCRVRFTSAPITSLLW